MRRLLVLALIFSLVHVPAAIAGESLLDPAERRGKDTLDLDPKGEQPFGIHGIHGRTLPIAFGVKQARPELNTVVVAGDGHEAVETHSRAVAEKNSRFRFRILS